MISRLISWVIQGRDPFPRIILVGMHWDVNLSSAEVNVKVILHIQSVEKQCFSAILEDVFYILRKATAYLQRLIYQAIEAEITNENISVRRSKSRS